MTTNDQANYYQICIIGGGAAGLSAGYFLSQQGYKNVIILEKEERVGGKCLSVTYDGKSFDLGANYITSSYKQVKRLAKTFNADYYTEGQLNAYDCQQDKFVSVLKAVAQRASVLRMAWQILRYILKRISLNGVISPQKPGFKGIAADPTLSQPFRQWLLQHGLSELNVLFQIPLSLMGYGQLSEIPAAYALTYLTVGTFIDLVAAAISPKLLGYPKRFTKGYQRLWAQVSWELNVKAGAVVTTVTRTPGSKIRVNYAAQEQRLQHTNQPDPEVLLCDYLILAVPPLYAKSEEEHTENYTLDMSVEESELFKQVIFDPFIVTTYILSGMDAFTAATFMIPEPAIGQPFVLTRQFEDNDLISIYTRSQFGQTVDMQTVLDNNAAFVKKVTGKVLPEHYTYSEFPYFPHITSEAMASGFYDRFEAMQGEQNTFYVGGLMSFELVETIVNYSKHLIEAKFPKVNS